MNVFGGGFLLFLIRASKLATLRRQCQGKIDLVWAAPQNPLSAGMNAHAFMRLQVSFIYDLQRF